MRAKKALADEISDADQRDNAGREKEKIADQSVNGTGGHSVPPFTRKSPTP